MLQVLDCLDLPPEYSSLLTCNDAETNLHAVPLWMVRWERLSTPAGRAATGACSRASAASTLPASRRK